MGLTEIINSAYGIVDSLLVPLAFTLCLLYFFWGVAKYIRSGAGGDKAAEEGKRIMVWGVVALFIAFSIWGIIRFIRREVNLPEPTNVNSTVNFN